MKSGGYMLALLFVFCSAALADDFKLASSTDVASVLKSQQEELAQRHAHLTAFEQQESGPMPATPASFASGYGGKGGNCSAWVFSTDLLVFTARHNDADVANRFDTEIGYRLTLAKDSGCGRGLRVRYLNWDESVGDDITSTTLDVLDIETLDVELYTTCDICCATSLELSAGLRYIDYFEDFNPAATTGDNINHSHGIGPVVGLTVRHCIVDGLAVYGLARESIVAIEGNGFGADIEKQISSISELQLGVAVTSSTAYGTAFARAALEGQHYGGIAESLSFDTGLFGGSFSVGLSR